ncbi:archaellum component FlaC [Chryseobacterium ginsenosidimutans]|uniref:hypothetical protein n=2 Tax=Chryseobacterium ginsenosidimutans TaxID=687846 RepID=UPI0027803316|nr:hypothetical protein [Chryseobacterium ginsenosidimutans]MDQ0593570.1 archaellum component FlaC [Chryseobacterium ginsenosidimutans]
MDDQQAEKIISRLDDIDNKLITLSDKLSDVLAALKNSDDKLDYISRIHETLQSIEEIIRSRTKIAVSLKWDCKVRKMLQNDLYLAPFSRGFIFS